MGSNKLLLTIWFLVFNFSFVKAQAIKLPHGAFIRLDKYGGWTKFEFEANGTAYYSSIVSKGKPRKIGWKMDGPKIVVRDEQKKESWGFVFDGVDLFMIERMGFSVLASIVNLGAEYSGPIIFANQNKDAELKEVERLLVHIGFDPGPVDGILDKKTEDAIQKYQKEKGLSDVGNITEKLMCNLYYDSGLQYLSIAQIFYAIMSFAKVQECGRTVSDRYLIASFLLCGPDWEQQNSETNPFTQLMDGNFYLDKCMLDFSLLREDCDKAEDIFISLLAGVPETIRLQARDKLLMLLKIKAERILGRSEH